jgi:cytochrome c553
MCKRVVLFLVAISMAASDGPACRVDVAQVGRILADGKQTFAFACTRCHGEDGNADTYAGIRKLGGIGSRLSASEIKVRLRAVPLGNSEVIVRGHVISLDRLNSLVAYVSSLRR